MNSPSDDVIYLPPMVSGRVTGFSFTGDHSWPPGFKSLAGIACASAPDVMVYGGNPVPDVGDAGYRKADAVFASAVRGIDGLRDQYDLSATDVFATAESPADTGSQGGTADCSRCPLHHGRGFCVDSQG